MPRWNPIKHPFDTPLREGDRVMWSDERWAEMTPDQKRVGRRGGVIKSIRYDSFTWDRDSGIKRKGDFEEWLHASVLWDGRTSLDIWPLIENLMFEDVSKIVPSSYVSPHGKRKQRRQLGRSYDLDPNCYPPLIVPMG